MIGLFIFGFIFLGIVILICLIMITKLSKDESMYMEVSDKYLKNIGKDYTSKEYGNWAYSLYSQIISGVEYENYELLRDVLADQLYNNYLISISQAKERNVKNIVSNMSPIFSKLVNLTIKDDIEIAKVWMRVSYHEYVVDVSPIKEEDKDKIQGDRIISGSKTKRNEKEYILTFVKNRTEKESIACPNCGYVTRIISQNNCTRCGSTIVNRKYHWVLAGKEEIRTRK